MRVITFCLMLIAVWILYPLYMWGATAAHIGEPGVALPHLFWFHITALAAWTILMLLICARKI